MKIPYMLIVGDKEIAASTEASMKVTVRKRGGEDLGQQDASGFIKNLEDEIQNRTL
jgi:threonyl-tRNA synthetase